MASIKNIKIQCSITISDIFIWMNGFFLKSDSWIFIKFTLENEKLCFKKRKKKIANIPLLEEYPLCICYAQESNDIRIYYNIRELFVRFAAVMVRVCWKWNMSQCINRLNLIRMCVYIINIGWIEGDWFGLMQHIDLSFAAIHIDGTIWHIIENYTSKFPNIEIPFEIRIRYFSIEATFSGILHDKPNQCLKFQES